ncbi:lipid droplet-regulating VLDL assembly factor AUP1 [Dendroctonus ponderosae]
MTNLQIENLVNSSRFPDKGKSILLALLYLPVGLLLLLLRCMLVFIFFILGQILPNTPPIHSFLSNFACLCFGIIVSVENRKTKENVEVFVSNSLSIFDHVAISKAIGTVLPLNKTPLQSLPAYGTTDFGSINNTETFKRKLEAVTKDRKTPILVCPEESTTNGNALLKFNSKYFKFFQKVQPLCITIKRPVVNIAISTLGSTYMNDIIYFMFSPFTNYSIKFLPSMDKKSLSEDEFADVVRQNIAAELKIEATQFSSSEVAEWSKRRLDEERRRNQEQTNGRSSLTRFANPQVLRMVSQVKEVLPHVPIQAIYNDLAVTRSVDTTITNILEGRVRFTPEASRSAAAVPSTSSQPSTSPNKSTIATGVAAAPFSHLHMAASTFGKNASERTRSFQERKEQLIAAARRRYIEKHNLELPL